MSRTFIEFFAGGGMARLGLGPEWRCLLANDICDMKAASYIANFGPEHFRQGDIGALQGADLPEASLWWASSPCQDVSEAGARKGLGGERSGTLRDVWRLLQGVAVQPRVVVIENVPGLLTADEGGALRVILGEFDALGYSVQIYHIDAIHFVPQSRPRVFIVAAKGSPVFPELPEFPKRTTVLLDVLEQNVVWDSAAKTLDLLMKMDEQHLDRIHDLPEGAPIALNCRSRTVKGVSTPRWEAREDDAANCLRTAGGGSSVQKIYQGGKTRRITPREAARLQGLPESYRLPQTRGDAHTLVGDGVCVPAVSWLERNIIVKLV
jgi:DNA (cytosine-5)-methyltransferase 1